ncbi:stalk domain-containing protein [Paenibacillus sp. YPG26]|uniref:stalk domain-containing protein n=1 Tax=Paenibacillus sp. YPG26 TaxID=2878915 RepID=UPI00203D3AAD|nr:stalk domain-containing protein [Paenibacillus sp. YPG26]USB33769.1 copper amine oxidase N-terminal domain-containing protein [Paenibacillus sp. YPG26]
MIRKRNLGIALAILGMTVTGAAGVYAGSNLQQIKAYLNYGLGVEVDGTLLKDSSGRKLNPITYQNVTYLPVRAVAQGLGSTVNVNPAGNTVQIKSGLTDTVPGTSPSIPATDTKVKSSYLPSDFRIPEDAKFNAFIQSTAAGKKYVIVEFTTKDSFETLYSEYKTYLTNHGFQDVIESKNADEFSFNTKNTTQSWIISGTITKKDNETLSSITINWSEQ